MSTIVECRVCGDIVEARVPGGWHPSKLRRRTEWAMREHLRSHSAPEIFRRFLRDRLAGESPERRLAIVRTLYRSILGDTMEDGSFEPSSPDGVGRYAIDEVLNLVSIHRLWHVARDCSAPTCLSEHP